MESLRKIKAWQFRLARWLLHLWIRPSILGCSAEELGIAKTDLVCYVLPFRSLADLLVVDRACEAARLPRPTAPMATLGEKRAFFFAGHPAGWLGRRTQRPRSARMSRLFKHLGQKRKAARAIKVLPVSLFWGHQPDKEKSFFKLLLSENWSATSGIKKFLAGLFHRRHILVQFSQPIDLAQLAATVESEPLQVRKLHRILRVHWGRQRQAILGPDLSHRRTLLNTILQSQPVREAIAREAGRRKTPRAKVEKKARKYAREIAACQSYHVVRFMYIVLTWLWNRLYDGIEVKGVEQAKRLAQNCELIYTPSHRSHIDYLLLSYVLYINGLTPPHIAAGKNLNLPLVGPILRRGGGFFMRRSFRGDLLYSAVFDEYLHQMFTKGYSVEYFIEGTRSRTGRTLHPKRGMLSMTLRSFQRDSSLPIAFMPVYFGYERVLEAASYESELAGKTKKSESLFDIFKIFRSLRNAFGKVTVNFGEPVLLHDFLAERAKGWPDLSPEDFSACCASLSLRLAENINAAVAVKATSLVALVMLASPRQKMEAEALQAQVELLREVARGCGQKQLSVTEDAPAAIVQEAQKILGLASREQRYGAIVSATPEQVAMMTYSANNVIHVYMLPSLVARYLLAQQEAETAELEAFVQALFPHVGAEMFLGLEADQAADEVARALASLARLGLVQRQGSRALARPPAPGQEESLGLLARLAGPTLERFYLALLLLKQSKGASPRQLEATAAGIAERLTALYGINSPDYYDRPLFAAFLRSLRQAGLVLADDGALAPQEGLIALEKTVALTLEDQTRQNIARAVARS